MICVCTTESVCASVFSFACAGFVKSTLILIVCVCLCVWPKKGAWFKGWQEGRAEIKSLNCYIFHLHLFVLWRLRAAERLWLWFMDVGETGEQCHPSSAPGRPRTQSTHTITMMNMTCFFVCFLFHSFASLPSSGFSRDGVVLSAAAELSEINNLPFLVHPSLCALPCESWAHWDWERAQIHTDRHAWREGDGDPDKGEINIGNGGGGYVHRCCKEM